MEDQPNPHAMWEYNFIQQMKRLREARKMTQTDLARQLKAYGLPFHQPTVQRIETGERPVRLNEAHLIAKVLGVDVDSMATAASPSDREIRYAVDRLRSSSELRSDEVNEVLGEWVEDVESFALALMERIPASAQSAEDLDPVTRWGMAWAFKVLEAWHAFLTLWEGLEGIGGESLPSYLKDAPELQLPDPDVMSTLQSWQDRFAEGMSDEVQASGRVLYARFPGEGDTAGHEDSEG
ncbi:helix-turn-helix transcriptional regulator [Streptosporangium sp. NPDC049248]|uniref:helix-turn-helix domain-containing protein n=1 Tax=Streptosporangium sp. NPDC049248 TaxID=3155651 RepID=UPI00342E4252